MASDRVRPIQQFQPISDELIRHCTERQKERHDNCSVRVSPPAGGLRPTFGAHIKANPTEPNLVSGFDGRETIDLPAVYECSVS